MTIWNLGSINADVVYAVPHIPAAGETLASTGRAIFIGGKGANLSVAAPRAGAHVRHIGAVGADGRWAVERLLEYGVDTRAIAEVETETAQAIVAVDPQGENAIILHPGANASIPARTLDVLDEALPGGCFVFQNETNLQVEAAERAKARGLRVVYAAAPFDANAVGAVLDHLDMLILNAVEAEQLRQTTGQGPDDLPVRDVVVTLGAEGATWFGPQGSTSFDAVQVTPIDTTGAGDTFAGYLLAGLDLGMPMRQAIGQAMLAAALMVTRHGTADVIPDLAEVQAFRP